MTRAPTLILLLIGLFLSLSSVAAQDAGRGLIVEGNSVGETALGPLNPLLCRNVGCRRLTGLLFPSLLRVDPQTRTFAPATVDNGLAESWTLDGDRVTFQLRPDRLWSDGQPITAYDVYFSYLAAVSDQLHSPYEAALESLVRVAAPLNPSMFAIAVKTPNCDSLDRLNFPIIPAHVFDAGFADSTPFANGNLDEWAASQPKRDFSALLASNFNRAPTVTAGPFHFDSRVYDESVRLISADGLRAFEYVDSSDPNEQVNRFLRGEINLIVDPPFERLQDLRAANDVTLVERPGSVVYSIRFNLADPQSPASDKDEDGNPVDQGHHPILSDVAVRQAMPMALNRQAIIDAAMQGSGTEVNSLLAPASWAYDGATPPDFDPMGAARMLEAAGWKDTNGDGVRECITCATAEHGASLVISLVYDSSHTNAPFADDGTIADLIRQQLGDVGLLAEPMGYGDVREGMSQQSFDAALVADFTPVPDAPDQSADFTPAGDILYSGLNFGSYRNDHLTEAFDLALHVPACDVTTRAELYAHAQQILRDDPPAVGLFSPHRLIAVRGDARTLLPLIEEYLP